MMHGQKNIKTGYHDYIARGWQDLVKGGGGQKGRN